MCLAGLTCASPCQSLRNSACIRSTLMSCTEACRDPARMRRRSESGSDMMGRGLDGCCLHICRGRGSNSGQAPPKLVVPTLQNRRYDSCGEGWGKAVPLELAFRQELRGPWVMGSHALVVQHAVSLQPTALTSLCRALEASVLPAISKASLARCCCQSPAQIWEQPLTGSAS